jgi:hypothetical protein
MNKLYNPMTFEKILTFVLIIVLANCLKVKDFKPALFHTSQPSGFWNVDTG